MAEAVPQEFGLREPPAQEPVPAAVAADERVLHDALSQVIKVTQAEHPPTGSAAGNDTPLEWAWRIVAGALGVGFHPPDTKPAAARHDSLEALAHASGARLRRVALRPGWWRRDNGPLLAFREPGQRPVALLFGPAGRYWLHEPGLDGPRLAGPEAAASLSPFAYSFFRTFSDRPIGAREFLRFGLRGHSAGVTVLVLAGLGAGVLGLAPPVFSGILVDQVIPSGDTHRVWPIMLGLVIAAGSAAIFQLVRNLAVLRLTARLGVATQAAVWDRLLKLPVSFFGRYAAGDLAARLFGLETIRQTLGEVVASTLLTGTFALVNLGVLLYFDFRLAAVAAALLVIWLAATVLAGRAAWRAGRPLQAAEARLAGFVLQLVDGIADLRVAGAEARGFARWAERFAESRRLALRPRQISLRLAVFNSAFPTLALVALLAAIAPIAGTRISTGAVVALLTAFGNLLQAGLDASSLVPHVVATAPLFENARPILQAVPETGPHYAQPGELSGRLEVRQVSFRYYPAGPLILEDVSVEAQPGEFIAIVGASGAGKSTLMRLLLGFEAPSAGAVYFDGQDLAALDPSAVRRQIGVVLQSAGLIPGDILSNIVGSTLLTLDDAWEAARLAGIEDDIRRLPMGMHTLITEGTSTFSGGQRQRLMIARAVVNRPRLLFFDEATSALDNDTQLVVSRSLAALRATRVVIAHRLSTIKAADRIYVLEAGRVIQCGTFRDLADHAGPFHQLIERQVL
jgi:NHLM bacteriocin system ABC transporter ATP-binding protein